MNKYQTFTESTTTIVKDNELVGILYYDVELRKNVIYSCRLMPGDEIAEMISGQKLMSGRSKKSTSNKPVEEISDDEN